MKRFSWMTGVSLAIGLMPVAHASLVATYTFNNTLNAQQAGVAALTAVDPENTSGFVTANVFGNNQTVWQFNGVASPAADQGGLDFNTTGLISDNDYSVEMVFQLFDHDNAWRRLLDSLDRQSDAGLYIDPGNNLQVFPNGGSSSPFSDNTFFDVFVTVDPSNTVTGYFDGLPQFSATSTSLVVSNNTLGFFLDNVVSSGIGEWSAGDIALIKVFDTALDANQVKAETLHPFAGTTPEPGAWLLLALGIAGLALLKRRRVTA